MQNTFSTAIFIQIIVSVVAICFTGFVMLDVSLGSPQFMSSFVYMNAMFIQILLYCFFGHSIMTNSEDVNLAMYMSNWYISEKSVRKTFIILMERCKAPIIFTAAKIFPVNLVTLSWIMRSSYSFLAVLRTMYDRDNKN
nr:odorant receptor 94a-like [Leptinotarsa decemlineata]